MREMRDSGVAWIGEVPAEWKLSRIGSIFSEVTRKNDGLYSTNALKFSNGSIVRKGTGYDEALDGTYRSYKLVAKGDEVINCLNLNFDLKSLRAGQVEENGIITSAYLVIRNDGSCIPRFYDYAFKAFDYRKAFHGMGSGIRRTLSWQELKGCYLQVPPLPEQRRIAGWLDERCADIDAAVEAARASIDEYEAYKKSVISHAVTRGLDPDAPLKDTGVRWIGAIPEHWGTVPLKAVTKRRSGHTPDRKIPEYWDGDIVWVSLADSPYLRKHRYISESKNHITPAGIEHSSAEILPSGCVLLSRDATVGLCAITKTELAVSQHFMAYECGPAIYNEYLLDVFYAMNDELIGMSMGSTIPTIGLPLIRKLVTPLPPLPEQRAIAAYLDSRTAAIDAIVAQKRAIVEDLLAYKKSLIYEAVTGKREV